MKGTPVDLAARPVSDSDHIALSRLVIEHAWRIDSGKADTLHELYTEDGELYVLPAPLLGRSAIHQWGLQMVKAPPWRSVRHVCSNMRFVSLGADEAEGVSVFTVYMAEGKERASPIPWSVGEDHDRFVRTDLGWRFAERRWRELFSAAGD